MDSRLKLMLILECCIALISYLPYAIELSYTNITYQSYKSPLRKAWENVFIDRKITRLNSSHRFTYLVCRLLLEKKKNCVEEV